MGYLGMLLALFIVVGLVTLRPGSDEPAQIQRAQEAVHKADDAVDSLNEKQRQLQKEQQELLNSVH